MREIILKKRYPHSREEDITDAFMRGYEKGKADRPQAKWIPCSERLPEREGRYLVTNSVWGSWTVDVCVWIGHWHSDDKPIAWMELPKAWEGRKR